MTPREEIFKRVRAALGRPAGSPVPDPPPVRMRIPEPFDKIARFTLALTNLDAKVIEAEDPRATIASILDGRSFVTAQTYSREACASAGAGITWVDYGLADTGSLVFLSESRESRLISLLPPCHIAVIERAKILTGLDELFTLIPRPADQSSSMVLVTGPSRTADIEMRLVRGVHGPGELHVVIVEHVTALL